MVQGAGIVAAEDLSLEKLSGSIDINIAGDQSSGRAVAGSAVSTILFSAAILSIKILRKTNLWNYYITFLLLNK